MARFKHLVCLVSDHHRTTYAPTGATDQLTMGMGDAKAMVYYTQQIE